MDAGGYATFVVARLKELHHREGLDVVMIQAPNSLRATVAYVMWPANKIGLLGLQSIERDRADFDTVRRLRTLALGQAATCLIVSAGDQTVSPEARNELQEAVQRSGKCHLITEPAREGVVDRSLRRASA